MKFGKLSIGQYNKGENRRRNPQWKEVKQRYNCQCTLLTKAVLGTRYVSLSRCESGWWGGWFTSCYGDEGVSRQTRWYSTMRRRAPAERQLEKVYRRREVWVTCSEKRKSEAKCTSFSHGEVFLHLTRISRLCGPCAMVCGGGAGKFPTLLEIVHAKLDPTCHILVISHHL